MIRYYLLTNEEGYSSPLSKKTLPFKLFKMEDGFMFELICTDIPRVPEFLWWPKFFEIPPEDAEVSVDELVDKFKEDPEVLKPILGDI